MTMDTFKNSNTFRVLFIGFLILILLIPMGMVESVIYERSDLYRQANHEITESWGREQLVAGPILSLSREKYFSASSGWSYDNRYKYIRPESIKINSQVDSQIRYRGIHEVPVYTAELQVTGEFRLTEIQLEDNHGWELELNEAYIQIPIQSAHALKKPIKFIWNGEELVLKPKRSSGNNQIVMMAKLPENSYEKDQLHSFSYTMTLAGSGALSFISSALDSEIKMQSNWSSPSFFGVNLPTDHEITEEGFSSSWQLSDVISDFGYGTSEIINFNNLLNQPSFGVRLIQPVDTYQIVTRAAKYAVLFIGLTFMIYFFTELVGKVQLHPVQYLFVGIANCIFYLLLLSLAEHINFNLAYFISSFASVALISLYSKTILKSNLKALLVCIVTSSLYTYLFVTLRSEGFALLIGSFGLFTILSAAMYLTRNIDWHRSVDQAT